LRQFWAWNHQRTLGVKFNDDTRTSSTNLCICEHLLPQLTRFIPTYRQAAMAKLWIPLPGLFWNWKRNFFTMKSIWEKHLNDIVWWNTSWNIVIKCYMGQINILIFFLISRIKHLVTTWWSKEYLSKMFT
jgi:hypothetical protein